MGKAKKTRKFAAVKRLISPKDFMDKVGDFDVILVGVDTPHNRQIAILVVFACQIVQTIKCFLPTFYLLHGSIPMYDATI